MYKQLLLTKDITNGRLGNIIEASLPVQSFVLVNRKAIWNPEFFIPLVVIFESKWEYRILNTMLEKACKHILLEPCKIIWHSKILHL
jgi:hypothetical protein